MSAPPLTPRVLPFPGAEPTRPPSVWIVPYHGSYIVMRLGWAGVCEGMSVPRVSPCRDRMSAEMSSITSLEAFALMVELRDLDPSRLIPSSHPHPALWVTSESGLSVSFDVSDRCRSSVVVRRSAPSSECAPRVSSDPSGFPVFLAFAPPLNSPSLTPLSLPSPIAIQPCLDLLFFHATL
jgi:hypothetical protein